MRHCKGQKSAASTVSAKEKAGMEGALNRCRALTRQIETELVTRTPEEIRDVIALADLHASLERAAEVLSTQSSNVKRRRKSV
jgi:hypothetical protein